MAVSTLFEYLGIIGWTEGDKQSPAFFVEKMGEVMSRRKEDVSFKKQTLVSRTSARPLYHLGRAVRPKTVKT